MIDSNITALVDDAARVTAIGMLDRSLLVEAGAGSGKTAIMAGRIAMLLAGGANPRSIAAVTFTELAAGELLARVRGFVDVLASGRVPPEMAVALPGGLQQAQRQAIQAAAKHIDTMTCSTIHGFCQNLILPYPVEADIDPGASVMDRDNADLVFDSLADQWLRSTLDGGKDSLLSHLVADDSAASLALVRSVLGQLRGQRALTAPNGAALAPLMAQFASDCAALQNFVVGQETEELVTIGRAACFMQMHQQLAASTSLSGHALIAYLQGCTAHRELCTAKGTFSAFQTKTKWREAARAAGLKAAAGDAFFEEAAELVRACEQSWTHFKEHTAVAVLVQLLEELAPVVRRFADYKRNAALLDFDDLINAARALLRDHDDVRRALGRRYRHVLVDEFQDTDPLQAEILWRLCGDPAGGAADANGDWASFAIRPGALFLVGDPKQAIYRFRGADIAAYTAARDIFERAGAVLSIATNFRSCAPILDFVNERYSASLGAAGQPGFTALDAFHVARPDQLCVAALDVAAADENGKALADQQRDAEAEAVADLCARLIGHHLVGGRAGAALRPCVAGDIALLAPTGSGLWRYEEALERRGIAVATQAGKGFYRRQEVQDLIALCRVMADGSDTIALGALLRGPLVGLSEEALMNIVVTLPRDADAPQRFGRLSVHTDCVDVINPLAREVLAILQDLRRRIHSTTPHLLLAEAVDCLRVRPLLLQRYGGRAERALANVDKFITASQAWSARGMTAFADAMREAWADEARAPEGQPDAQEDAVTLYTMHAAKGLEWPIVVPINTLTGAMAADGMFCERSKHRLCCAIFGTPLPGYADDLALEKAQLAHERVRLWYVAATRAEELLVLPRLDVQPSSTAWSSVVDLRLAALPAWPIDDEAPAVAVARAFGSVNTQSAESFRHEAARIAAAARPLRWRTPSRDEGAAVVVVADETAEQRIEEAEQSGAIAASVQGGRSRGLIMHKLFEEVLTGETPGDEPAMAERAAILIGQLDPLGKLAPAEIAGCVRRTLAMPQIAVLLPRLQSEYPLFGGQPAPAAGDPELLTAGVADAIARAADGSIDVVIDWKSDVAPTETAIAHYRSQLACYLALTGAQRGLIVLATEPRIIEVGVVEAT